ncbi:MAG: hypothetical protein HY815_24315 [Candidatus Riflebacteria bacterium]|nr:hypothetical protein [Candidatus Riflebacteria bacterium]
MSFCRRSVNRPGRSTAVGVLAWHFARLGRRVVAVDLDLEAPGLGNLLLQDLPDYGLIDWLVESLVAPPDPSFIEDCLTFSPIADGTPGVVSVVPALGCKTKDYVSKVGRVFLPGVAENGDEIGLAERLGRLLSALAERDEPPDVVLLDSRAGLHDIGAAAVTRLGAEVFLFTRDEPQSWEACRLLFEHLSRSRSIEYGMPDADLRWKLKMVAAQVEKTQGSLARWLEASYETCSALYDDEARVPATGLPAQVFVRDDPEAPHHPLPVYFDQGLRGVVLLDDARRPPWPVIEAAFGQCLTAATARLFPAERGGAREQHPRTP